MTNYVKQKFQWFFDMSTNTTGVQRIDVSAGGQDVYDRLKPFFAAFKYYKLGAVKIRMIPAATLPVDPTGLSYEAGEQTVDPRDMFNPGLVRITNGEDIADISDLTNDQSYYATMLDKRWFKFRLQSGFRRTAKPLFWSVGQVEQDMYPGMTRNIPIAAQTGDVTTDQYTQSGVLGGNARSTLEFDNGRPFYQTGQKMRMGWLPTDVYQNVPGYTVGSTTDAYGVQPIPEIPLITVFLPKAYKTRMYYRVYVEETVMFKGAVAINPVLDNGAYYHPVDRYVTPDNTKVLPYQSVQKNTSEIAGGGYQ